MLSPPSAVTLLFRLLLRQIDTDICVMMLRRRVKSVAYKMARVRGALSARCAAASRESAMRYAITNELSNATTVHTFSLFMLRHADN